MEKRKNNSDFLRIVSAIAIIMIHVDASWMSAAVNVETGGYSLFIICVYNSISRFAVPCFLMLSGAFILDDKRNLNYRYFYSKSFKKIGVPMYHSGIYRHL